MKTKLTFYAVSLFLIMALLIAIVPAEPVLATAPTTSLTITRYAADRTTIVSQVTVSATELATGNVTINSQTYPCPIQGDGIQHYFTQGPTFDPTNLWDPAETLNLKDKGAPKGTDIKDLCALVGGAGEGDTIQVCASDNYGNTEFPYANVYNPDPRQGKMVICWYDVNQGDESVPSGYVPTWPNGMLLVFFAETTNAAGQHVFGHQDMHDCLPSSAWHYYLDGVIQYPSTNGLYVKYVNRINIFTDATPPWTVTLHGALDWDMDKKWFEDALGENCHGKVVYDDGQGNVWSGLPLWYACGIVDDTANTHGPGAFNDNLYYDVKVTGGEDNYNYTFDSRTIARNNYIILANELNGQKFSSTFHPEYNPLKLVSPTFTVGGPSVARITSIDLLNISTTPPSTPTPTPGVADWPLYLVGALEDTLSATQFQSGVDCHGAVTYTDDTGTWSGLPLWKIVAFVDDGNKHGAGSFNDALANTNYQIKVYAADGYIYTFYSQDIKRNDDIILANLLDWEPLPVNILSGDPPSEHPAYPLKITGPDTGSGSRIGAVVKIELIGVPSLKPAWDLNNDHVCNIGDVVILGLHWGETGSKGWIPEDLNADGVINIGDVVALGLHWGATW
jgi:hypothetical protein